MQVYHDRLWALKRRETKDEMKNYFKPGHWHPEGEKITEKEGREWAMRRRRTTGRKWDGGALQHHEKIERNTHLEEELAAEHTVCLSGRMQLHQSASNSEANSSIMLMCSIPSCRSCAAQMLLYPPLCHYGN